MYKESTFDWIRDRDREREREREINHTSYNSANIGEEVQELHMLLCKNHLTTTLKSKMLEMRIN